MKKIVSLLLILALIGNVSCFHSINSPQIGNAPSNIILDSGTRNTDGNASQSDATYIPDLPPLEQTTSLPQLIINDAGVGPNGEAIFPMRQNDRAPFVGILFNSPALAYIQVEYQSLQQRCLIDRTHDREILIAGYTAQLQMMQVGLDTSNREHQIILNGRDQEISNLNHLIQQHNSTSPINTIEMILLFGGGFLLGGAIVGATAYLLTPHN